MKKLKASWRLEEHNQFDKEEMAKLYEEIRKELLKEEVKEAELSAEKQKQLLDQFDFTKEDNEIQLRPDSNNSGDSQRELGNDISTP